jgi:hypothetical protein
MKSLKVFSSICLLALFSLISGRGLGQLSINNSNTITETFSGYLGTNTFPTNWTLSGTSFMGSNQSSGTSGGWYGNSNISFLGSGSASNGNCTWRMVNNTGSIITGFTISFVARLWRSGSASPTVSVSWSNSASNTNPSNGALTNSLSSVSFNDATSSISSGITLTQAVSNISINNGQFIFIRFIHPGGSSSDNLGWDDITFTPILSNSSPTLTSPTVSSITESSAVLGANITSNGGSAISARGTVYSTSSPVTSSNNASAEGGVSTGVFTQSRTGLSAQSQYYYAGYATNSTGTGLSSEGSFRTLSNPPTSQASGLTATVSSASQIDLSITNAAGFPASGATQGGYLLIYSTSTPTLGSVNGQAPSASSGNIFSTSTTILPSNPATTINVTGLSSSTSYNFIIIPYTWDGTNSATYNYLVTNAITVSATTNAGLPTLISPTATNITSTSATLGANITSNGGSNLTARGTVYSTSSPVSSGNNALAEGGTSTGVFTQNRTSLNPQTLYYFAGYATSSAGTSLSPEGSFRTLSEAPTSQVSSINATASSPSEIVLSIGGANFPNSGATNAGYVIIYSTGTPTFASINGQAPSAGVGTIFSTTSTALPSNPATTINVTGLLSATTYNFIVVPYTWDGSNATTYNYLTSSVQTVTQATPAATYIWIGSNNGSWTNAANWSPNRNTPSSTDNIVFNGGNTLTITGIITQSIASLSVLGSSTKVTLTALASSTLNLGNVSGVDLNIASGCELNLSGSYAIAIVTVAGATGSINGSMKFTNAAHSLVPTEANAVVFNNGSNFIAGDLTSTGFSGNPFGSNSGSVYNGVIFANGATFIQNEGSNPFAYTQPNSRVQFQAGSNFIFSALGNPSLSGRTFGNLEINTTQSLTNLTGGNPLIINGNLTLTSSSAAVNFNLTGGISIAGNINVSNGQTLGFSPSSAGTLTFNGSSQQTIGGEGSITFGSNTTIQINTPSEVQINKDLSISGNLTINNSGVFNIQNNKEITLTGNLTNNGTLTLENGATLVQGASSAYSGSGTVQVKQNITGANNGSSPNGRFWYLGSPVASASSAVLLSNANNILKRRNEQTSQWETVSTGNLEVGQGYYTQAMGNATINFTGGLLNNGPITIGNLSRTAGQGFEGFNLVSNPYPSYLNWDAVTKTDVGNTMWYRTASGSTAGSMVFDTYVAGTGGIGTNLNGAGVSNLVPPMQSFWVRVNSGSTSGSLGLTNAMRAHFTSINGSVAGLKSTSNERDLFLRMNLLQANKKDQIIVYVNDDATNGFDQFDGEKMMQAGMPQFYTSAAGKKITINGLNSAKKQQALPITMELPTTGVHSFVIEDLEIDNGLVWLEDKQEEIMQALEPGTVYEFYANSGINAERFVLHFQLIDNTTPINVYNEVNGSANFSGKGASVHAESAGVVVIKLPATTEGITDIQIRDAAGRLVYTGSTNTLETSVQLEQANGIYYVTLNSATGVEVRKVFIQQ